MSTTTTQTPHADNLYQPVAGEYLAVIVADGIERGVLPIDVLAGTVRFAGRSLTPGELRERLGSQGVGDDEASQSAECAARAINAAQDHAERSSSVTAEVASSPDGVQCGAHVYYAATGRAVPRAADEGGDFVGPKNYRQAAREALDRAGRTGRTVIDRT